MNRRRFATLLSTLVFTPALAWAAYENPVRASDLPDPSLVRTRDGYWAAATSSEWAPHFPLLFSRDLVNWEPRGAVFHDTPSWAKGSFWAPEIAEYKGTYFVYYTARRHDGRLAVAVATAAKPEGPYTDHGELVAQEMGSIDAMPFTDDEGRRWLIWKEDGNSRKLPTRLFLQRLREDGLKLEGERRVILTNDTPWEGAVVEGPFVLKRGEFYYLFYSGAGCCGRGCNYGLGVARARQPEGPWEKCPANPLLAGNETWLCPGHGSIAQDAAGRYWLLYHAYAHDGFVVTGRQMLLDEVVFNADGWPTINQGRGPSRRAAGPSGEVEQQDSRSLMDPFDAAPALRPGWQWPIGRAPESRLEDGWLKISATGTPAVLAQPARSASFVAETRLEIPSEGVAGLAAFGNESNYIGLVVQKGSVRLILRQRAENKEIASCSLAADQAVHLRISSGDGVHFRFAFATAPDAWTEISAEADGDFLPQWDRATRVGLYATRAARFDYFSMRAVRGEAKP